MTSLFALVPCLAVILSVIVFRRSGLFSAGLALSLALLLWLAGVFSMPVFAHLTQAVIDTVLLFLLVGSVIFFGLFFVEVSNKGGGLSELLAALQQLNLSRAKVILCVTIGIGVTVESLTGYGVSLLVTIPILIILVTRRQAIWLGLIGMSLMSWGALSVAALLGAEMAGLSVQVLASQIVLTSGPVAFLLPLACLVVIGERAPITYLYAAVTSLIFVTAIALTSHFVGVELAGVGGGLAVLIFILLNVAERDRIGDILRNPSFRAYGLLIACLLLQKFGLWILNNQDLTLILASEKVAFNVFASPAWALAGAGILWLKIRSSTGFRPAVFSIIAKTVSRAWRPVLTVALFLLTARLLVESGGITALAASMADVGGYPAIAAVVLLGAVGAYATGSGVTANALFMPAAASTGAAMEALPLFAALQHSGAAHAAMASLPILALLLAAMPTPSNNDGPMAARAGLILAGIWIAVVIAVGWIRLSAGNGL